MCLLCCSCNVAGASDKKLLKESCVRNGGGNAKQCDCIVNQMFSSSKIKKMWKMSEKRLGPKFKKKVMTELTAGWWTADKYKNQPPGGKLNDEQGAVLALSMNASFPCANVK